MIRIENLSKSFGQKILFQNVTYHFPQGERIALVGANGAGKTTLLNILCNMSEADNGTVLCPAKLVVGYLPQIPNPHPLANIVLECVAGASRIAQLKIQRDAALEKMTNNYSDDNHDIFEKYEQEFANMGGYLVESRSREILVGLGFRTSDFDKSPLELSGGWRMRLELAKVFLNSPDFLILDEPTNHLDLPSLVWVERYLNAFQGTVLFVSHDRSLVNRIASIVLHLYKGKFASYKGNFDSFLEQREARAMEEAAMAENLRKRRESLEHFIERFGSKASKAKQAQSKLKMLSRIRDLETEVVLGSDEALLEITLPEPPSCGREVFTIDNASIGYSKPLITGLSLRIQKGMRVAIIGVNGIGKSTLLKTISNCIKAICGSFKLGHNVKLAYFAQEQIDILNENASVLENLLASNPVLTEKNARSLLGSFLFRGSDVFKPVAILSGGEKSRVGLARLLTSNANFLVLDEPTNHLDMSSVEALASALTDYKGTALFVSHDREFINQVCTHVFAMLPDGRTALFAGNLDDYERLTVQAGLPNILDPAFENTNAPVMVGNAPANKIDEKHVASLKRDRQKIERLIDKAETNMVLYQEQLSPIDVELHQDDGGDYQKSLQLNKQYSNLKQLITDAENEWLEASTQLEAIKSELKNLGRS